MEAERIEKIEELFHAALEVSSSERADFLRKTCGADKELIREVASLLAFEDVSEQILDASTEELAAEFFPETEKSNDLIGVEVGHFKIEKLLGKGGMGEVYLAEDVKLDRKVALKFLPPEFVENKDRLHRFIREAKTASALNHPNIITIYEINEFDGIHLIATEFIDGQTLNRFTKNESLSIEAALDIAIQIASALDEAHSAGIVHRDIKPDNVMIRANGIIKVLDFGIAKLLEKEAAKISGEIKVNFNSSQAFRNSTSTMAGLIMGTAEYMSPEQACGNEIDTRTDIFSFGVMFYQLLSGKLPFEGENSAEIIEAILHREPKPFDDSEIPAEIEKIVRKCLQKKREDRYQTIGNVLEDLKEARRSFGIGDTFQPIHLSAGNIETRTKSRESVTAKGSFGRKILSNKVLAVGFAILLISLAAFFGYQTFSAKKQIRSVAVMPFVNESGNQNIEYLSDGMTEMLIRSLANIPNLSLKARSTVFTYKGKETPPNRIGAELKVDAVLLGRLSLRGEDLELHLELVETATQDVLWSENYERKLNELALLQNELVADVSDKLRLKLTAAEQQQAAKIYTNNSEAQQLYLKGRFHWNKRNGKDFERAIGYFNQAVEKDPNYALAYTGLADTLALMPLYGNFRPQEYMPKAKQAALKALELDENLSEAHASLGRILNSYDYDWKGAEREFKRAIKLKPNYPTVYQWYAEFLAFSGRTDEALAAISTALELDPFSLVINRMKGNILIFANRPDEAIAQLNKTIELYPENALIRFNLGDAFVAKKMYAEAVEQYLVALKLNEESPEQMEKFKTAYKNKGWQGFWQEHLETLLEERKTVLEQDKTAYYKNESLAFDYAATRNKEKALEFLEKSFEEREAELISIKMTEFYDFLADEPRFQELTKKIGLP